MEDTIHARHPDPEKQGVSINRIKYEQMRLAIESALSDCDDLTFIELTSRVRENLKDGFDGSIEWYMVTVKLDMEAEGVLERIPGRSQRLRLVAEPKAG
ncbi:hypothetical protein BMS3Bbin04_01777 [bacterium BMS3Bbin04]|nr:hypothetical protein BMS3Bbin04_01777 [bacterium BMS3Bbin04]